MTAIQENRDARARNSKDSKANRAALKRRTRDTLSKELHFIPNSAFREMDEAGQWRAELAKSNLRQVSVAPKKSRVPMPAHLERLCDSPLLDAQEEKELFRSMNYLKFRANSLRSTLNESRPSVRKLEQIDNLLFRAEQIRNEIVSANTRLIVSIVKKFSDDQNRFDDLLSEGIASLIKAVEKFDYDRGFRFSTYATMVVRREIYRSIQKSHKNRTRFVTGQPEVLNEQDSPELLPPALSHQLQAVDAYVPQIVKHLDEREQFIVNARYGFLDLGMKATFANLGAKLGISKERVRQLELRAVEKLRVAIHRMGIHNELRNVASQTA